MTWWRAAWPEESERPTITMMKTQASSSVEASRATLGSKRMTRSLERSEPAMITRPSTSSAVANSEPTIADCATAPLAGAQREDDDEELGEVAERRLQQPGRRRG